MDPTEQQLIYAEAEMLLFGVVLLMVILIGYGAFLLGFIAAVRMLTIKGAWGRPQTILLSCLVASLVCFTWSVICNGGIYLSDDRYTLQTIGLAQAQAAGLKKTIIWQYMPDWPVTINLLLSDGIVAWRACSLFQQDRFQRLILAVLMIANIGINVADCIWADLQLHSRATTLDWLSSVLSLSVNMIATILFACKARKHHRYISGLHGSVARKGTCAENILNLLMESGAIFCVIQSINIIITFLDAYNMITSQWALEISEGIIVVAYACYPVTVITLAHRMQTNGVYYMNSKGGFDCPTAFHTIDVEIA
ncbi:hypothetical protein BDP27DRAFT_1418652 [Rhodocollybia butyracea]|uniref:Uncharacterized protein n=1 Tax=Rhodocollybia butyracea TaxID=206335 RepID=A0A9P5PT35_9AGAR|nr:hypothetical protein BDP27DRAFT_1418652 [Rhodocollybia butyracea]